MLKNILIGSEIKALPIDIKNDATPREETTPCIVSEPTKIAKMFHPDGYLNGLYTHSGMEYELINGIIKVPENLKLEFESQGFIFTTYEENNNG